MQLATVIIGVLLISPAAPPVSLKKKLREKVTFRLDFNFGGKVCIM